ncbi:MAG: NAD(P)-binding protein [Desulfosoma sp.]|uniref:NAD(P)-binding protein n=1 Tax=Desulfosoma sp. TaxID=2603217 RepID=UPI00404A7F16
MSAQSASPGSVNGSVMVIGGGIAGMQASLDLANSGFRVLLVERDISIGGNMAKLDKTFPTNDCSTCMISPKLIEVASHPNIEILTRTTVTQLAGEPGRFQVTLRREPRYVLEDRCTACGECVRVCPIDIPADFNQGLDTRKAIYRHFPQAIPSTFAIDKKGMAPCKAACPAGISVQGYIALIAQGRYREALDLIRKDNPLPAVCGRVCHHPCEKVCSRGAVDEPVAIDFLKRFVCDWEAQNGPGPLPAKKEANGRRVAIVGAGPAGLTAAYYLALEGYSVTIFEAMPEPGGWLRYGIPEYRLPRQVLKAEIDYIQRLGVEIRTNTALGKDFQLEDLRREGYEAFFLAIGTQTDLKLNIPGENLKEVYTGTSFLKLLNSGHRPPLGRKVAVIGGGNIAMDVARSCVRLGLDEVHLFYRRSREEMPANPEEFEEALQEGVQMHFLAAPVAIHGNDEGHVTAVECIRMELGEADESGRRRPIPVVGSEYRVPTDSVIAAVGLMTDPLVLDAMDPESRPVVSRWGTFVVDPVTYETHRPGVFAGGDVTSGPASVVQAIAAGKEVAISIDRYLRGVDLREGRFVPSRTAPRPDKPVPRAPRAVMPRLDAAERIRSFQEVQLGFDEETARAEAQRCLQCGVCSECYRCVEACLPQAIDHQMMPREDTVEVGAILYACGYRPFDAVQKPEYGYGRYPNVITSLEYERILAASGPTKGHVQRPSDGAVPKRIAWIQCVGSRDASIGRDYCSSVCCMYATKQAIVTKDHEPDVETTIFYIDLRAMGKGFERYWQRAESQHGVRYVRSQVSRVVPTVDGHGLEISYVDENNTLQRETFDMVVLSVGLGATQASKETAHALGVALDRFGFIVADPMDPVQTSQPGVFSCGVSTDPKDIPETVAQASAAAASAQCLLASARHTCTTPPMSVGERTMPGDIPRIGVFVCHCGINIAGVVDVKAVADYAATLPNVAHAENLLFTCSTDSTEKIKKIIQEKNLNRVVVASCSPRTHEPLFQECLREAGVNKYLFEMANIRDQCSWVHGTTPEEATNKSKDLVRMAVAKALFLEPLHEMPVSVIPKALVVGGGMAGMTAARYLADQGFFTYLVEREAELGGQARAWMRFHASGLDVTKVVFQTMETVLNHPNIEVLTASEILSFEGHTGHFLSRAKTPHGERILEYGALVVATGGEEYQPKEYGYGEDPRVITQLQLQKKLAEDAHGIDKLAHVVMIQCVGSRDEERPYCSRVCCTAAVVNALRIKEKYPKAHVTILYRDIRTFGTRELYYRQARAVGVRFLRYRPEEKPTVSFLQDRVLVDVLDQNLKEKLRLRCDLVVLSAAIVPRASHGELAGLFKLSTDADGFFMEAHVKLRPLDFASPGLYLCGLAHSPKFLEESIAQAKGAAARAATVLSREQLFVGGRVAVVDPAKCAVCLTCVRTCPYEVPVVVTATQSVRRSAYIDPAKCQGCGACVAECPGKAIQLQHFTDVQLLHKTAAAVCLDLTQSSKTEKAP